MTLSVSIASDNKASAADLNLDSILAPVAADMDRSREIYQQTILRSPERNLIENLINGQGSEYLPESFRVSLVDQISRHLLQSDGKWVRAALVLMSAGVGNKIAEPSRQIAVAVELVHLATLVHDDIIDEAPLRRGIQSVANGWGNSIAVLLGDLLFSRAFRLLLDSRSIPAQAFLTEATGKMCMGEIAEMQFSFGKPISENEYMEMIAAKTAALMAAATAAGGSLLTEEEETVDHFRGYGHSLGMTFQIVDDVLDFTAPTETLGKESGVDIQNEKITLPLIHLMESDPVWVTNTLKKEIPAKEKSRILIERMNRSGSIEYAYARGHHYALQARTHLNALHDRFGTSDCLTSLDQIIDFVLFREK